MSAPGSTGTPPPGPLRRGTLEFHAFRTSDIQYLNQTLASGYPVIVGVNLDDQGVPGHFALVVGKQNGQFLIQDPGHSDRILLNQYGDDFETRGYVGDPPGNVSGFDLAVDNAADVFVVDPLGREIGYVSGTTFEEIPQSVHFADTLENDDLTGAPGADTAHTIQIYQPLPGTYQVFLVGLSTNTYKLNLRSYAQNGSAQSPVTLQGTIQPGAVVPFQVTVGAAGLVMQPYTNACPWTANLTNGAAPLHVRFTAPDVDASSLAITNWHWNFGDGSTSSSQDPVHSFTSGGTFIPSLTVINSAGVTGFGLGPSIHVVVVPPNWGLIHNGGFETGDFTCWTVSGQDTLDTFVDDGSVVGVSPHGGDFMAALSTFGDLTYLSQNLATQPATRYLLSFWLGNPDGATPDQFSVTWNGKVLLNLEDMSSFDWTNYQFMVVATGANSALQFTFMDDPSFLGLDDISVLPAQPSFLGLGLSGNDLVLDATNGLFGATYSLLTSTNLALPSSQWTPLSTNVSEANGRFRLTATNAMNPGRAPQFFMLELH